MDTERDVQEYNRYTGKLNCLIHRHSQHHPRILVIVEYTWTDRDKQTLPRSRRENSPPQQERPAGWELRGGGEQEDG